MGGCGQVIFAVVGRDALLEHSCRVGQADLSCGTVVGYRGLALMASMVLLLAAPASVDAGSRSRGRSPRPDDHLAYGTKPALLAASAARLVAGEEDPGTHPAERRWAREVAAAPDPHTKLARYVKQIGDVTPRIAPLIDVLRTTAPAEPEVAAFLEHIEHGRREGPLHLLGHGVPTGTWRPGLSADEVADIVFAIASTDTFRALSIGRRWTRRAAEKLIVRMLERELLP